MDSKRAILLTTLASAVTLFAGGGSKLVAQTAAQRDRSVDVAVTFLAQRSLRVSTGQNFWTEGGSVELGANAYKGFGMAADVTGSHTSSIGTSGIPLSYVTETFGPRYRWHDGHRVSVYGQGLIGEANAFHGLFPAPTDAQDDATSFAIQAGGGIDIRLERHLNARVLDAAWLRTQLPNSTNNVQNNVRLGAGLVFRFGDQ